MTTDEAILKLAYAVNVILTDCHIRERDEQVAKDTWVPALKNMHDIIQSLERAGEE